MYIHTLTKYLRKPVAHGPSAPASSCPVQARAIIGAAREKPRPNNDVNTKRSQADYAAMASEKEEDDVKSNKRSHSDFANDDGSGKPMTTGIANPAV